MCAVLLACDCFVHAQLMFECTGGVIGLVNLNIQSAASLTPFLLCTDCIQPCMQLLNGPAYIVKQV